MKMLWRKEERKRGRPRLFRSYRTIHVKVDETMYKDLYRWASRRKLHLSQLVRLIFEEALDRCGR